MELTVLVDNTTRIDQYLPGEPGLALLLREDGRTFLFDCGYSDIVCRNAVSLGIDLAGLDTVILSHGHLDHTWGLFHVMAYLSGQAMLGRPSARPRLLAHPEALAPKTCDGQPIGNVIAQTALNAAFDLELRADPVFLTDRLAFLGEIPRRFPDDASPSIGVRQTDAGVVPDEVLDDTALAYRAANGLVVITGCCHAGLANTVERARDVMGEKRIAAVIGGLHLHDAPPKRIAAARAYLERCDRPALYPCHCTGLRATLALAGACEIVEVGVGDRFVF